MAYVEDEELFAPYCTCGDANRENYNAWERDRESGFLVHKSCGLIPKYLMIRACRCGKRYVSPYYVDSVNWEMFENNPRYKKVVLETRKYIPQCRDCEPM